MFENRVFVVADGDHEWRRHVADQLTADGGHACIADDRVRAVARCAKEAPDVLVLGEVDGQAGAMVLLREIRAATGRPGEPHRDLPVLVALADEGELAVLRAFDAGADDVTSRDVGYAVLRARLRALLGRDRDPMPTSRIGELAVDRSAREVRVHGRLVDVSAKEFGLLCALATHPVRVFTKRELLRDVWAYSHAGSTRTLDSHACRLRGKLAAAGAPNMVVNVWGVGYRLLDAVDHVSDARAAA